MSYNFKISQTPSTSAAALWETAADKLKWHSLLLLRDDEIIFERYAAGHSATAPHVLWSLSKSFVSMAVGMCIDQGLFGFGTKICDIFAAESRQLGSKIDKRTRAVTIKHLLTMSAGKECDLFNLGDRNAPNSIENFLSAPCTAPPGTVFAYNSQCTYMLSAAVTRTTGHTVCEYLMPRLFEPLGIAAKDTLPRFDTDPLTGVNIGGWGLHLCTRDIAAFGRLLLANGSWDGRQLISVDYVRESTGRRIITSSAYPDSADWGAGYGYQFWQCAPNGTFRGDGAWGQFCIVDRPRGTVAAVTGEKKDMQAALDELWRWRI